MKGNLRKGSIEVYQYGGDNLSYRERICELG